MDCNLDEVSGQMMLPQSILDSRAPKSLLTLVGGLRFSSRHAIGPFGVVHLRRILTTPRVLASRHDPDGRWCDSL